MPSKVNFDTNVLGSDGTGFKTLSHWLQLHSLFSPLSCLCLRWWEAFFNLMGFICILLVYFWKKYHLYIIFFAVLSLLFPSPSRVVGPGFDFLLVLGAFLILRAIYPGWQSIRLSWPHLGLLCLLQSSLFLLSHVHLISPDLSQPCYSLLRLHDGWESWRSPTASPHLLPCPLA